MFNTIHIASASLLAHLSVFAYNAHNRTGPELLDPYALIAPPSPDLWSRSLWYTASLLNWEVGKYSSNDPQFWRHHWKWRKKKINLVFFSPFLPFTDSISSLFIWELTPKMWRETKQNGASLILTEQWTLLRCISVMRRLQTYAQKEISFQRHLDCPSSNTLGLLSQYKKKKKESDNLYLNWAECWSCNLDSR